MTTIPKVQLIHQGVSPLRKGKHSVYVFKYDLMKAYIFPKVKNFIIGKVETIPSYEKRMYMINIKFQGLATNSGWMLTNWMTYEDMKKMEEHYKYLVDSNINIEYKSARFIEILIQDKIKNVSTLVGSLTDKNDCLFSAIFQSLSFDKTLLPKGIKVPSSLKSKLGLERKDKVPLDLLPKVEELFKCSFTVSGDYKYQSKEIQKYHINLKCQEEHITLKYHKDNVMKNSFIKPYKKENIYTIFYDEDLFSIYNGKEIKQITKDEYKETYECGDYKYMLLCCQSSESLVEDRDSFLLKADQLLDASNGLINYFKFSYDGKVAYNLFRKLSQSINEPEAIDNIEHKILDSAFHGGIHYATKGEYKNCYDYDINSMYPFYMMHIKFIFPATKPEYKIISQDEFINREFTNYGLYKVKFGNFHKFWNKKNLKYSWYTHYDIEIAKLLGMTCQLIEDETNALLYASKDCLRGNKVFKPFVEYCDELSTNNKELKSIIKPIRNSLWGFLANKNIKTKIIKTTETYDYSDVYIRSLLNTKNHITIKSVEKENIFKYSWARCSIFLTGYCRLKMIQILLQCSNQDDIICINTDGFVSKTIQNHLIISDKIGDMKIKQQGDCIVNHSNSVIFN
jgi:hypothetical protein